MRENGFSAKDVNSPQFLWHFFCVCNRNDPAGSFKVNPYCWFQILDEVEIYPMSGMSAHSQKNVK